MLVISPFVGFYVDQGKEKLVLIVTIIALLVFNTLFYNVVEFSWFAASLGLICWGVQRVGASIAFAGIIFKSTPTKFYGTAIGIYSLLTGLAFFVSSSISGYLVQTSFNLVFLISGLLAVPFSTFYVSKT